MNYFKINTSTLEQYNNSLYEKIQILQTKKRIMEIRASSSGHPTALVEGKLLHSSHNPVREAEKLISATLSGPVSVCIIEGFGLGYYVEAALNFSPSLTVIVVDPSLERFKAALETRDMTELITSPRLILLIGSKEYKISSILVSLPPGDIKIVRNRNLYSLESDYFHEVERYTSQYLIRQDVNKATLKRFGQIWIRNLIYNMNVVPEAGDLKFLENIFGNYPVLLLAAGPSLDKIVPHLKKLKEKFIIVAVDTAVNALLRYRISPDFLLVIDPQYWNARHIDRMNTEDTILISESSTYPSVFKDNYKQLYFSGSLFPLGQFLEKFIGQRKRLGAGGSVSTSAWDFCHLISTGPVYCAGLDLGFPSLETHYKGSFFEERAHLFSNRYAPAETEAFNALNNAHPFPAENNEGGETLTDKRLIVYKQWFEEKIEQSPGRKTYTLSSKGIRIRGITYTPMEKILSYPVIRDKIKERIDSLPVKSQKEIILTAQHLIKGVNILIDELERLSLYTGKSIDLIETYMEGTQGVNLNQILYTLDSYDKEILNLNTKNISGFLIQPVLKEITEETGKEDTLLKSRKLYSEIKKSSDFHLRLLKLYVKNYKESSK